MATDEILRLHYYERQYLGATVRLYKALGGSWKQQ